MKCDPRVPQANEWCDSWYDEEETKRFQEELYRVQHPEDCARAKYFRLRAVPAVGGHGLGSYIHVVSMWLAHALEHNRTFYNEAQWFFSDVRNCPKNTMACIFWSETPCVVWSFFMALHFVFPSLIFFFCVFSSCSRLQAPTRLCSDGTIRGIKQSSCQSGGNTKVCDFAATRTHSQLHTCNKQAPARDNLVGGSSSDDIRTVILNGSLGLMGSLCTTIRRYDHYAQLIHISHSFLCRKVLVACAGNKVSHSTSLCASGIH